MARDGPHAGDTGGDNPWAIHDNHPRRGVGEWDRHVGGDTLQVNRLGRKAKGVPPLVRHAPHVIRVRVGDDQRIELVQIHVQGFHIAQQGRRMLSSSVIGLPLRAVRAA